MKKGCMIALIVLAALLIIIIGGAFVSYKIGDQKYGLSLAPAISHERAMKGDTRIRLALYPDRVASFLPAYMPSNIKIPTGLLEMDDVLRSALPREVAVLLNTDIQNKKLLLTLFANEKFFGRLMKDAANGSEFFTSVRQVHWLTDGFELPERGFLYAEGDMPIPDTVEEELYKLWPTAAKEPAAPIEGKSHAELVIDNRNGDIMTVAAALVQASGQNWDTLVETQYGATAIGIMESIRVGRLKANLMDTDTAAMDLRIDSDAERGPGLQFLLSGMALPYLRDFIKKQYNLILEGDLSWNADENAILGTFKLTGLEAFIKSKIAQGQ